MSLPCGHVEGRPNDDAEPGQEGTVEANASSSARAGVVVPRNEEARNVSRRHRRQSESELKPVQREDAGVAIVGRAEPKPA